MNNFCNCDKCRGDRGGEYRCVTCGVSGNKAELEGCYAAHMIYVESCKKCEEDDVF
jgi:hypothetical protein